MALIKNYIQEGDWQTQAAHLLRQGEMLKNRAALGEGTDKLEAALSKYEAALQLYQTIGDRSGEAQCLLNIKFIKPDVLFNQGQTLKHSGQLETALLKFEEARQLFRAKGNLSREGEMLTHIARVHFKLGKYQPALNCLQQVLAISPKHDNSTEKEARIFNDIGWLYFHLGQYQRALGSLNHSLSISQKTRFFQEREIQFQKLESNLLLQESQLTHQELQLNSISSQTRTITSLSEHSIRTYTNEGKTITIIGLIYSRLRQYKQAQIFFQEALSIWQKIGNQHRADITSHHIELLNNVLSLPPLEINNYSDHQKRKAFKDKFFKFRVLNQSINKLKLSFYHYSSKLFLFQKKLPYPTEYKEKNLNVMGLIYHHKGQYQKALDSLKESLVIQQKIGDRQAEGTVLNGIGRVYTSLGKYEEALNYHQQALTISRDIGNRAGEGMSLHSIGGVLTCLGDYQQALDYYQQALVILQDIHHREGEAASLDSIGEIYTTFGEYQQALNYYQQARAIFRDIGHRKGEGTTLNKIGHVYFNLGQYEQALDYHHQSLTIKRDLGHQEGEGASLDSIGLAYSRLGQYSQALNSYQQSLAISRNIGDRAGEGATLNNIGLVYLDQGQYQQALNSYQQSLAISRNIGDRAGEGATLNNIGIIYFKLRRYQQALKSYKQSLTIAQEIGNRTGEWSALTNIGYSYYISQSNIASGINFYKQAIEVTESIQSNIKIEELKSSFADQQIIVYQLLIFLLCLEGRFEEAFNYIERSRSRAFLDQMANGPLNFRTGADTKLLQQEETLKSQITSLRNQLTQLLNQERSLHHQITALRTQLVKLRSHQSNELDTEAITSLQQQINLREKDYSQLLTQLKLQSPEVASLVSVDVPTLREIMTLLDPDTTLVEYFVIEKFTLAFVITHQGRYQLNSLKVSEEDLTKKVNTFRNFTTVENPHPKSLQQLHEWLIAPLKIYLTTPKVTIVPHGILHYLPFAALTDGQRYLCDDYAITTLPSASVLRFLPQKRKPETETLLALGNPTPPEPLPSLHHAEQEVKTIAQLYGTQPLVGAAATETAVRSQAGKASILHIAAHGKYNLHNPLFSTLYLAPDEQNDGRLEVHEIYSLDLTTATNLVVLSACQTQMGQLSKGDEIVALNRAFLYAGTPSVLASLWSVDDKVTGLLMERFYTHLRAGMSKAEALRQAQIDTRVQHPHPYYWAAFVLTGD